jgi:glucokinase
MTQPGAVLAVDVGGTTIKAAVIDAGGRSLAELDRPTAAARGPEAVVSELLNVIAELSAQQPAVNAVGVVVPGVVDAAQGVAKFSANLGFRDLPIAQLVQRQTGLPALLEHDVRAAGAAEYAIGLTAGRADCLLVVIGTGIAGVIHAGGSAVRGATGVAGELGHIPVWPEGEACPCGQRGCLERYASAASITRRYAELNGGPALSAAQIAARLTDDQSAARVWGEATKALALALATCTMLLDPAVIVLAGGLSQAGQLLMDPVRGELEAQVKWRQPPPVLLSGLGGRAGLLGAAVLTWQSLGLDDFQGWLQPI